MTTVAPPAPARPPRMSTATGRYRRWHVETRTEPEEEGWLITYLDVITLILVLMVVMLAFAGPGKGKEGSSTEAGTATATVATTQPPNTETAPTTAPSTAPAPATPTPDTLNGVPLDQLGDDIEVLMNDDAVRFRISSEVLFVSGAAQFTAAGLPMLDKLIPLLNADPTLRLVVEGHTDSQPIQTERFPSNWELSTGRAAAVARYLIEHGIAPQRVQASGFSDTRPLGSRDNPVDRIHNRRVELAMERKPSPERKPR